MELVSTNILEIQSFRGTYNGDKDAILDYLKEVGSDDSNRKTTQSYEIGYQDFNLPSDIVQKPGPISDLVTEITDNFSETFDNRKIGWQSPWTIINKPGEQIFPHNHDIGPTFWSAVYWAQVPENSGQLEFYPLGITAYDFTTVTTQPTAGDYLIFPGWILHGVRQNCSTEDRVSMSFNMTFFTDDDNDTTN